MKKCPPILLYACILLLIGAIGPGDASAQIQPRYGLGFNSMLSSIDGFGIGLRGRASAPVNSDLSFGVDLGFTGFVFGGRRDATYIFDPQVSAIVTLPPRGSGASYILAGIGAHAPMSNQHQSESGPTVHFGAGRVQMLRETTIFYELNPALLIGLDRINLLLPFRVGFIF